MKKILNLSFFALSLLPITSLAQIAPFTETFDAFGIPEGWTTYNTHNTTVQQDLWQSGCPTLNSMGYNSSSVEEHSGNGGYYVWSDGTTTDSLSGIFLQTDSIDISALNLPSIEFYYYSNNIIYPEDNVHFYVEVFADGKWHRILNQKNNSPEWQYYIKDLSRFKDSGKILIRFATNNTTSDRPFYNDIAVDDIKVDNLPSCYFSGPLVVRQRDSSTAQLSWSSNQSSEIIFGPAGFNPHQEGRSLQSRPHSASLKQLEPGTAYEAYAIGNSCDGDDKDTIGPLHFRTLCTDALKGEYRLGHSASAHYNSLEELNQSLRECGLAGPTLIQLEPGRYEGQLILQAIAGLSDSSALTIRGSGYDTISYNSGTIISLNRSPHVKLEKLFLLSEEAGKQPLLSIRNGCHQLMVENCRFLNLAVKSSGKLAAIKVQSGRAELIDSVALPALNSNHLQIRNNLIEHCNFGIQIKAPTTSELSQGHQITGNTIRMNDRRAISLRGARQSTVSRNEIHSPLSLSQGVELQGTDFRVEGNWIEVEREGLLGLPSPADSNSRASLIANNIILVQKDVGYFNGLQSKVLHNTIVAKKPLVLHRQDSVKVYNNIFYVSTAGGSGVSSEFEQSPLLQIDHNLLGYAKEESKAATFGLSSSIPVSYNDLAQWQAKGFCPRSVEGEPLLNENDDYRALSALADGSGDTLHSLPLDFAAQEREEGVDMGALAARAIPHDLKLLGYENLPATTCPDSNKRIGLRVQNIGHRLDSNFRLSLRVQEEDALLISNSTGTLAPGEITTIWMPPFSAYQPGEYKLTATVEHERDLNLSNDQLKGLFTVADELVHEVKDSLGSCISQAYDTLQHPNDGHSYYYWTTVDGQFLGRGEKLAVGPLGLSDTSFVLHADAARHYRVGRPDKEGELGEYVATNGKVNLGQQFEVYRKLRIDSLKVYASSAGSVTINLRDGGGKIISSRKFAVRGPLVEGDMLAVNFELEAGSYSLDCNGSPEGTALYRNSGFLGFPSMKPGLIALRGDKNYPTNYYFFYDWHLSVDHGCAQPPRKVKLHRFSDSIAAQFSFSNALPLQYQFDASTSHQAENYYWDFGDGQRDTGKLVQHHYATPNNYEVTLVTTRQCEGQWHSDTLRQSLSMAFSLEQRLAEELTFFPNPGDGLYHFDWPREIPEIELQVFDLSGQEVYRTQLQRGQDVGELDLRDLPSGTYNLNISGDTFATSQKLVKL